MNKGTTEFLNAIDNYNQSREYNPIMEAVSNFTATIDSTFDDGFYLLYRFTGIDDTAIDEDGKKVPIIHTILCNNLIECMEVWESRISNFTGAPELLGFLSDIGYLSAFAYLLDDDLTD